MCEPQGCDSEEQPRNTGINEKEDFGNWEEITFKTRGVEEQLLSVCGGGVSGWGADPWQPEITLASCKQDKTAGQSSELDYSFPFASFLLWRLNPGVL